MVDVNPLTIKRLQKQYAKDIVSVMKHQQVSFLSAKLFIMDIVCSDEVKELVIKEI